MPRRNPKKSTTGSPERAGTSKARARGTTKQTPDSASLSPDVHARSHVPTTRDAREELLAECGEIAEASDVLGVLDETLRQLGVVGPTDPFQLLYLALTTRRLFKPVPVAIKAQSSSGKSFAVETVLRFFPESAYIRLSAQSEKAIVYSKREIRHRFLIIGEAEGLGSDFTRSLIRQLLTEGRLDYEYTVFNEGRNPRTEHIVREGPTGLIVTTTRPRLDPEMETRLLSVPIDDSPEQTSAIFRATAKDDEARPEVDLGPWMAFQAVIELAPAKVQLPFAETLAGLVPPAAVRMRRDFPTTLQLVRACALLHQETRDRATDGRVVATIDGDYAAVRKLIEPLVAEGVERRVSDQVRETVELVKDLYREAGHLVRDDEQDDKEARHVTVPQLARGLKLDQVTIRRRVQQALTAGYLDDLGGGGRGRPKKLIPAESLPSDDEQLLPTAEQLAEAWEKVKAHDETSS